MASAFQLPKGVHALRRPALCILALSGLSSTAYADADAAHFKLGRQVFTELALPSCTLCHTLKDANAGGAIGPNLDQLKPNREQVAAAVRGGVGVMPAFSETLSAEQIDAVAYYVSQATAD